MSSLQGGEIGKGALAGNYTVTIVKLVNTAPQPSPEEQKRASEEGIDLSDKYPSKMEYAAPKKYEDKTTSGLAAEVVKGKNQFDFQLTSSAK